MKDKFTHYIAQYKHNHPRLDRGRKVKLCKPAFFWQEVINPAEEVTCPLCQQRMVRRLMEDL